MKTNTFNASWTSIFGTTRLQRAQVSTGARQGTRPRQQRQPRRRRSAVGHDRADDRPQQLQPARNHDRALAAGEHDDLEPRPAQIQGRLRFSVRRHPEQLPRVLQRLVHVPHARVVCRRPAERRQRVLPAELPGARHDRARNPPEHPGVLVLRAGRVAAAHRPHAQHRAALRPDEDRPAPGAQSRPTARGGRYRHEPARRRHQQLGPASGGRVESGRRPVRRARRLGTLLRPDAVDHARHRPLEQRHQHRVADLHRRHRSDLSRHRSARFRALGTRGTAEHLLYRQGLCQLAADAGQYRCRMGSSSGIRA